MTDHIARLKEIRAAAGWLDLAAVDVAALDAAIGALSHAAGQEVVAYRWLRNGEVVSEWRDGVPTERQIQCARELIGTADWQPQFAYLAPAVARSEGE